MKVKYVYNQSLFRLERQDARTGEILEWWQAREIYYYVKHATGYEKSFYTQLAKFLPN